MSGLIQGEWARHGRPCLVADRRLPGRGLRGQIVRELNRGELVEVSLEGERFPWETVRVRAAEVLELPSEHCLFPQGRPRLSRPSGLAT